MRVFKTYGFGIVSKPRLFIASHTYLTHHSFTKEGVRGLCFLVIPAPLPEAALPETLRVSMRSGASLQAGEPGSYDAGSQLLRQLADSMSEENPS